MAIKAATLERFNSGILMGSVVAKVQLGLIDGTHLGSIEEVQQVCSRILMGLAGEV